MPQKPAPTKKSRPKLAGKLVVNQTTAAQEMPVNLDDQMKVTISGREYTIRADDLTKVRELGRGAYGEVHIMKHKSSGQYMAVKRITISMNETERKRMRTEITASKESYRCPYMVLFYGAMIREGDVWICMEVMNGGSLDKLLDMAADIAIQIPEKILAKMVLSILRGLLFMKEELNLMHRDVKPSNVLINRQGQVKICDFGISGHLTNSVAKTMQAGCKPYMAPERISPQSFGADVEKRGFDIRSDVWSIGITMVELATGKHPYMKWKTPFEQLKQVVEMDPPTLPEDKFSPEFNYFIKQCLIKKYDERPRFRDLLQYDFITNAMAEDSKDVAEFTCFVLDTYKEHQREIAKNISQQMDGSGELFTRGLSNLSLNSLRGAGDHSRRSSSPSGSVASTLVAGARSRSGSGVRGGARAAPTSDVMTSSIGEDVIDSGFPDDVLTGDEAGGPLDQPTAQHLAALRSDAFGGECSSSAASGCSSADSTSIQGSHPPHFPS